MLKGTVDRFESDYAIIEFTYNDEIIFVDVIRNMLPFGAAPGDPLTICKAGICDVSEDNDLAYALRLLEELKSKEGKGFEFNVDSVEKKNRHQRIKALATELFKD